MANGKKTDQQRIEAAERRIKALELRKRGASFRVIGDQLGVSGKTAHQDYKAAMAELAELEHDTAEEYRTMELARLDMALIALAPKLRNGNVEAINAWIRASESRRKLLGLDAPAKTALTNPDGTALATQQQMIGVVLNLLAPYPDLRLALAAQLTEETDAADDVQD